MQLFPNSRLMALLVAWAATAAVLTGCTSSRYQNGDPTARSMRDAAEEVEELTGALDGTIVALNDLVDNPKPKLKSQFQGFSGAVDRLIASAQQADAAARKLAETRDAYFAAWDRELASMNYGVVRDQSESRRAAVSSQIETLLQRFEETQNVVWPLIAYFEDIRKALGTDLTLDGVRSARELASKSEENTRKVQMGLATLASELMAGSTRLSSTVRPQTVAIKAGAPKGKAASAQAAVREVR